MIDTEEKVYIAELIQNIYGVRPKDVVVSQLCLKDGDEVKKPFFVMSYTSSAGGYFVFRCNGVSSSTVVGEISGVDGLGFWLVDEIVSHGMGLICGYEPIF